MTETVPAWTLWLPLIGTLGGAAISAFALLWASKQNRMSDEKKHLRQLLFNTALENWKTRIDIMKEVGGKVMPLDSFIVHMIKLSEIFNETITKENIPLKVKEIREITDAMENIYNENKQKSS